MTAEEARKLTKKNIDTKALQRLIDNIDERIKEACNNGNFRTYTRLWHSDVILASAVHNHYSSLGYTVTEDLHYTRTYTDIKISWE